MRQYAFLADRTGGSGLTWGKLTEPDNGMLQALLICGIEPVLLLAGAYYLEQVGVESGVGRALGLGGSTIGQSGGVACFCTPHQHHPRSALMPVPNFQVQGGGTGIRRHPLFFLGYKLHTAEAQQQQQPQQEWQGLRRLWQPRRRNSGAGQAQQVPSAQGLAAGGSGPAGSVQLTGATAVDQDTLTQDTPGWVDDYYGSFAAAQPTPQLPPRPLPPPGSTPVPRKTTSVRLSVTAEPASSQGEEAAEGDDVAGERARVEAIWRQW